MVFEPFNLGILAGMQKTQSRQNSKGDSILASGSVNHMLPPGGSLNGL
jgi:hypothetical protein